MPPTKGLPRPPPYRTRGSKDLAFWDCQQLHIFAEAVPVETFAGTKLVEPCFLNAQTKHNSSTQNLQAVTLGTEKDKWTEWSLVPSERTGPFLSSLTEQFLINILFGKGGKLADADLSSRTRQAAR